MLKHVIVCVVFGILLQVFYQFFLTMKKLQTVLGVLKEGEAAGSQAALVLLAG